MLEHIQNFLNPGATYADILDNNESIALMITSKERSVMKLGKIQLERYLIEAFIHSMK